jgi:ABC-2 type transport system ATP-binding protein
VSHSFGDVDVLKDVDLEVARGELFGLIGPSGSGKTTLMRLVGGLGAPTSGELLVQGEEPATFGAERRNKIGYVPQQFALYEALSVEQNARFIAGLYGLGWRHRRRRIREVLEFLELWSVRRRAAKDISGGMHQRLSLACGLLHDPEILLVDEPTAGLDPLLRAKVWEHLSELSARGTTIFVTTQYIDEATHCKRIAIMRSGTVISTGEPEELRRSAAKGEVVEVTATGLTGPVIDTIWGAPGVRRVDWDGDEQLRVTTIDSAAATPIITDLLRDRGVEIHEVRAHIPTFEEAFLELVKRDPEGVR